MLVRNGPRPLGRSMGSLLTGFAGAFTCGHKRVGHLYQTTANPLTALARQLGMSPSGAGYAVQIREAIARGNANKRAR